MPKVTFLPENVTVEVAEGETILDTALDNDIDLNHNCGGNCVCTTCHVVVEEGFEDLNEPQEVEAEQLEELERRYPTSRLGCQTVVLKDLVVRIPPPEDD